MKDLIIVGASGFGREVAWLTERINEKSKTFNILGFVDDNPEMLGKDINGYTVLGNCEIIREYSDAYLVCAVGSSKIRKKIIEKIKNINSNAKFATLIDPSVIKSDLVTIGEGSIICASTIITVNVNIGSFVTINLDCTIGHESVIEDFVTMYPSVNVSGLTHIGQCTELGTGMQIIQNTKIGSNSIVGAGAVVVSDIPSSCLAVGCPAKPIKEFDN